jgi:argininosuccinate lyase
VDTLELVLPAMIGAVETARFDVETMRRAASAPELFATDLAEELVRAGVPFREAHRRVGELLARVEEAGRTIADLGPEEWEAFGLPDGARAFDPDRSVAARGPGGPSPASVGRQLARLDEALAARRAGPSAHHPAPGDPSPDRR